MLRKIFGMALLAPLACGGGSAPDDQSGNYDSVGNPDDPADPAANVAMGTLRLTVVPEEVVVNQPVRLRIDGQMMPEVAISPGGEAAVALEAGEHEVGVVCPDYCWATAAHTPGWATRHTPCNEWELEVEVPEGVTLPLEAALCRDLTGRWMSEGSASPPSDVSMVSENGRCRTDNMPQTNLYVRGDEVCTEGGVCAPILDDGWRIEFNDGIPLVRVE